MVKADGCVAIHADGGAYKPLNWMNAPNTLIEADGEWVVAQPQGRDAHDHARRGDRRHRPRARHRSRAAEGRRRGPPAGAARRQPRHDRRRASARAPRVPDRHRPGRPALPRRATAAPSPSRSSAAARSTASSSWPATSNDSTSIRRCGRCAACSWPRSDQAPGPGAGRSPRHRLGRGRLRRAARHRVERAAPILRPCRHIQAIRRTRTTGTPPTLTTRGRPHRLSNTAGPGRSRRARPRPIRNSDGHGAQFTPRCTSMTAAVAASTVTRMRQVWTTGLPPQTTTTQWPS